MHCENWTVIPPIAAVDELPDGPAPPPPDCGEAFPPVAAGGLVVEVDEPRFATDAPGEPPQAATANATAAIVRASSVARRGERRRGESSLL
jgi:hypothetical protein